MPAADYRILTDATGQRIATALEGVENNMTDKLPEDFSTLSALPADPATGDLLPIASGGTTYKIDYNALAAAILAQAVKKSGDTMTGQLALNSTLNVYSDGNPNIGFMNAARTATMGRIYNINSSRRFYFRAYHPDNNSNYDDFTLPPPNGSGGNATYNILTTKSPVAIPQGGTGATTEAGARANLKVTPVLLDSTSGVTGLNVDFSSFGAFIIRMPDNMTTVVQIFGVPDAEFWSSASIYGDANSPVVLKSYCWKVNSSGTGFYLNTSKSYQINFSSTGTPSIHQITNNKFYKVWGIAN